MEAEDVIIIGSGPAGYTAALYAARAGRSPLLIEGYAWGGLLQQTTEVENYPGFPEGVQGPELMSAMRAQAQRFGARLLREDVSSVTLATDGGEHRVITVAREYRARALILATGASHQLLGVPGEAELAGRGVSYCATCDAPFFRDKPRVLVVGGGDSAMEEAIFLSKFAQEVAIVHRREQFRASAIMLERARAIDNITELTPYVVEELQATGAVLTTARLRHADGSRRELAVDGCFVAIGHHPNSALVAGQLPLDADGYVQTQAGSTRTAVAGVFAAGDLVDRSYRQAVTAAGSGCQAALDAEWYLR
jgi:thioredoxin reductase (NADPH)